MRSYFIIAGIMCLFIVYASCSGNHAGQNQQPPPQTNESGDNTYVPGLGEFMNTIQLHHSKLWFEGLNQNWPLARYETDEMKETFAGLQKYVTGRPEVEDVPMINASIDSMEIAIASKNLSRFKSAFTLMTNACNNCHYATNHAFIVITIPTQPPVTNQQFEIKDEK